MKITGLHTLLLILCDPRKCGNGLHEIGVIQPLLGGRLSQDTPWRLPGLFFLGLGCDREPGLCLGVEEAAMRL